MRRYSAAGQGDVGNSLTIVGLTTGGTPNRPTIYEILMSIYDTPADNSILWTLQRNTAAGTSTGVTPVAEDSGDPACSATAGKNHSAEPTYTSGAILLQMGLNQRSSFRWVREPRDGFKIPVTASNGIGLQTTHASFTGNAAATLYFEE